LHSGASLTAGIKVPLDDGNRTWGPLSLPMDYQPGLGTADLIFGAGYGIKKLSMMVALQQPLTRYANRFRSASYPPDSEFRTYQSTSGYRRKGDVLARLSYEVPIGKKWKRTPGLLPIFHLADDEYTDENGRIAEIRDSRGLTLNANVFLEYSMNPANRIEFSFDAPVRTRSVRPDGLTRDFVAGLEYKFGF
jgi:hypothetical protein